MLPFGHLAAGYLITDTILSLVKPNLAPAQINQLTLLGTFFAFAPDLDTFYAFFKEKKFTISKSETNHRDYWTHRPMVWLVIALIVIVLAPNEYWRWVGITVALGSWSHFLLDSIRTGVRWLWPFKKNFYALTDPGANEPNPVKGFFPHWLNMIKMHRQKAPLAFYLEIVIVIIALLKLI